MAKKDQKKHRTPYYFQIVTVKENKKGLSFTGYWILPDAIHVSVDSEMNIKVSSKEKPKKIPPKRHPVKYILPPCKSELEQVMDPNGRTDWCKILKKKLNDMEVEYIEHNQFY